MHQSVLSRLQVAQCLFGSVSCQANRFLSALTLGDVGIDQHKAAVRHRVPPDLDDPAIGTRAFVAHFPAGIF